VLRSIGEQSGNPWNHAVLKKKRKATVGRIYRKKEVFKPGLKE